ncbi:MAG TPA: hypothetical protein VG842_11785, partial [Sediminibacterium sp.]|nr:hypothetical protein [Sediminibacterium sp.]
MQRNCIVTVVVLTACICTASVAQSPQTLSVRSYRAQHAASWIQSFLDFLKIPNTADKPEALNRCAAFIADRMQASHLEKVQLLRADQPGIPAAVYGEYNVPGAKQTLTFYAHYDGQPVDSTQWRKGLQPFQPALTNGSLEKNAAIIPFPPNLQLHPDWRIYARGSADDKAGV